MQRIKKVKGKYVGQEGDDDGRAGRPKLRLCASFVLGSRLLLVRPPRLLLPCALLVRPLHLLLFFIFLLFVVLLLIRRVSLLCVTKHHLWREHPSLPHEPRHPYQRAHICIFFLIEIFFLN